MSSSLNMQMTPAVAPDGSIWIGISVLMGGASFSFGVPLDKANEFRREFAETLEKCVHDARKLAKGGIEMPSAADLEAGDHGHTCTTDPGLPCLGCAVVASAQLT